MHDHIVVLSLKFFPIFPVKKKPQKKIPYVLITRNISYIIIFHIFLAKPF